MAVENDHYNECMALFIQINKILQKEMGLTRALATHFENQILPLAESPTKVGIGSRNQSKINDTFGKLMNANDFQSTQNGIKDKSDVTVIERVGDFDQILRQNSDRNTSRSGLTNLEGTYARNGDDGASTNRIEGGLSMASSQLMMFDHEKRSSRRNVL